MTPDEAGVLVAAMSLAAAVLVERPRGTLSPRTNKFFLALAALAAAVAILHMLGL